jgi:hypothetical protein
LLSVVIRAQEKLSKPAMKNKLWFLFGFACCGATVTLFLFVPISISKGERGSGRESEKGPTIATVRSFLIAQTGSQGQKPERPPSKGNGRKD